ncbi:hypothetical protein JHK87_007872 [Glycine soja]|nr:hypothetical protein JHK87_007872 [Glycine soja]
MDTSRLLQGCLFLFTGKSFCKDLELERSQLAFSQPTSAGKALATSYTGTESFLAY